MRRRRRFDTFSLSFLDIMSCGFGSVILLFMVINATMSVRSDELNRALSLEAEALEAEVSEGRENLVALFLAGTLLFSGSLYAMALSGQRWLGAVTPFGGIAFLAGWLLLAWQFWQLRSA